MFKIILARSGIGCLIVQWYDKFRKLQKDIQSLNYPEIQQASNQPVNTFPL